MDNKKVVKKKCEYCDGKGGQTLLRYDLYGNKEAYGYKKCLYCHERGYYLDLEDAPISTAQEESVDMGIYHG